MKTISTLKKSFLAFMLLMLTTTAGAVNVKFTVDMTGIDMTGGTGVYIVGTLNNWAHSQMTLESGNTYSVTLNLTAGTVYCYYYTIHTNWADNMRETLSAQCATCAQTSIGWTKDRGFITPATDATFNEIYGGCVTTSVLGIKNKELSVSSKGSQLNVDVAQPQLVEVYSIEGKLICKQLTEKQMTLTCKPGIYVIKSGSTVLKAAVTK